MSVVTNVILAYGLYGDDDDDDPMLDAINAQIPYGSAGGLVSVKDSSLPEGWFIRGGKTLEVNIAIGAFNYLALDDWLINIRENVDFGVFDPISAVQLMVMGQEDDEFRILVLYAGPSDMLDLATVHQ